MRYNPFARNFYRVRKILIETLGLPRDAIRPTSTFAALVAPQERRRVICRFHSEFGDVLDIGISQRQLILILSALLASLGLGYLAALEIIRLFTLSSYITVPIVIATSFAGAAYLLIRFIEPGEIRPTLTVGDVAVWMTSVDDCREAGYRLSQHDIFLKVREIIVRNLGVEKDTITPETKIWELTDC